ncbi:MAG: hypothetical protein CME06_17855 [Gemmatimonadetes bacterium]|nr:hypothetical protein [Gemmatimonadota bacterium]
MRKMIVPVLFALFCSIQAPLAASAAHMPVELEDRLAAMPDDATASVIVHLTEQADIANLGPQLRKEGVGRQDRHRRVITALRDVASRTQPPLLAYLGEARAAGRVVGFTPHWISNLVVVQATKAEISRIRERPEVGLIEPNFSISLIEPVRSEEGSLPRINGIGVTPGLEAINADRVWKELGITGAGRLVADLDTGVDGFHPALAERWRGVLPGVDWSEAWLDLVYGGSSFPVDYYGHGTHVMGTMAGLGEATGDTVGVAFGAHWIACNAVDQGAGPEFDNDVVVAFEWLADPDGDPGTVDDVPDVVQNSWGINEGFGSDPPYTDCDSRWWSVIDNCEAAGCVVTFSAGNEGPGPQSHRSPSDRATTPYNCYSIGAVDATNANYPYPIASFSSRGPSGCDGVSIKPEVSAPGVDVYSSVPGGGYQSGWSGTSMAGPHVAGVVALMREANPDLDVDQIKEVLMASAHDFGVAGEDNTYGAGFIDAYEAVTMVMSGVGYLVGTVEDAVSGDPIPAELTIAGTPRKKTADSVTGDYFFILPGDSTYTVEASYFGYEMAEQAIYVVPDDTTTLDFPLVSSPSGTLAGMVIDTDNGLPISGALVEVLDTPLPAATSSERGVYLVPGVPVGDTYAVHGTAAGYASKSEQISVDGGGFTLLALPLRSGLSDDMESGENGWTHDNVTPGYGDQWHQSTQRNHTSEGTTSWKCGSTGIGDYADELDAALETPMIPLQPNTNLHFWHWMDAEVLDQSEAWDGGIVEISIDGGAFQQVTPEGGYPYTIVDNDASPFAPGTPCFSGTHDWREEIIDLSAFSGNASLRFRFGTDGYVTEEGWYIDDLIAAPDAASSPVAILLLPAETGVEIGPAGGTVEYQMALVNNTDEARIFDWWLDLSLAGGPVVFGPVETHTDTLAAGETRILSALSQEVPPGSTPGEYHFNAKLGQLPDTVQALSSFELTITSEAAQR